MRQNDRYQVFREVYEDNGWGRSPTGARYYSDSPPELTRPYREYVGAFIRERGVRRVVDLGCGDFEASSGIDMGDAHYVGVDIYDELVRYVAERHGGERREFLVRDIVEDDLPAGDLCLVGMVLYLLSEADVLAVLRKLERYRFVLITDGQPPGAAPRERRNVDKPTNRYTRSHDRQGFWLELPPYSLEVEVVLEYPLPSGEIMRTVLLENPAPGGAREPPR
jgi:SAM-dependent methyltransferase